MYFGCLAGSGLGIWAGGDPDSNSYWTVQWSGGEVDYDDWKTQLEEFVSAGSVEKDQEQSALMPLFHMATSNLPSTTRAPELDDRNAVAMLKADADRWTGIDDSAGEGITREDIGRYLRYLVEIKFLTPPNGRGRELPPIAEGVAQAQAQYGLGGRGGTS